MVAKAYQKFTHGEPYLAANNKMYVKILKKDGTQKEVRWYSEAEYRRLYPGETFVPEMDTKAKARFGFDKGYITIPCASDLREYIDFLSASNARWSSWFGWYFVSTEPLPEFPNGLFPITLPWVAVVNPDGSMKPQADTMAIVKKIGGDPEVCQ